MFGRATIRLGIGAHSSFILKIFHTVERFVIKSFRLGFGEGTDYWDYAVGGWVRGSGLTVG